MKRQRLNQLSHAKRAKLNRHLKDAMDASLIRPTHSAFGSPIIFVRKANGSLRLCIDYRGLREVTRKDAYPLPRVDDTLDELKYANFYTQIEIEIVYNMYRMEAVDVYGPSQLCNSGNLQVRARPLSAKIQPL
jgi:hypothetical protein